jgi:hypothetical protein
MKQMYYENIYYGEFTNANLVLSNIYIFIYNIDQI